MPDQHFPRRYNANLRHGRFTRFSEQTVPRNGVDVPQSFDWIAEHPQWPTGTAAMVTIWVDPNTGPTPVGIRSAGERHIDVRDILKLLRDTEDFDSMVENIVGGAAATLAFNRATGGKTEFADLTRDEQDHYWQLAARAGITAIAGGSARPQRRRRMTDELLATVAKVYRAAVKAGGPPTLSVSEHFDIPYSTAGRWVGEARKRGHLGAAVGPTSGER